MVEGFKLTAEKIKRIIKLAVHLPDDYYSNNKKYPLLLVLDGGLFFSFLNEDNKILDLKKILDEYDKEFIVIGLFRPRLNEWNISELNPYYSGSIDGVDVSYSSIFYEYIANDLLPLLKQKYRFTDDISVMGVNLGAISVIPLLARYEKIKKGLIFSLDYCDVNDLIFDDALKINNKTIYIYQGEVDSSIDDLNKFSNLEKSLDRDTNKLIIDYDREKTNTINDIEGYIVKGLEKI